MAAAFVRPSAAPFNLDREIASSSFGRGGGRRKSNCVVRRFEYSTVLPAPSVAASWFGAPSRPLRRLAIKTKRTSTPAILMERQSHLRIVISNSAADVIRTATEGERKGCGRRSRDKIIKTPLSRDPSRRRGETMIIIPSAGEEGNTAAWVGKRKQCPA